MSQRTSGSERKSQASVKVDGVWNQAGSTAARGARVLVGDDMEGGEEERPPRGVSRAAEEERVETISVDAFVVCEMISDDKSRRVSWSLVSWCGRRVNVVVC